MLTEKREWAAVITHPKAERLAATELEKMGLEVYLPLLPHCDKRFKNPLPEKPMFPCYLFAKINKFEIYPVRTARGVFGLVTLDHSVSVVPQRDIDSVRAFEATQRKVVIHDTAKLVKGAVATIVEGEFAGMQGRLVRGCKDGNFAVSIEVMNVSFVVHVRRDELKPSESQESGS